MKLSELNPSGRQQSQQRQFQGGQEQLGVIRNATAYPKPIDAIYQGQAVRIVATGDIVGMSPALQVVDEQGTLDWVSAEDVRVTQRRFLPTTNRSQIRQRSSQQNQQTTQRQPQHQTQ